MGNHRLALLITIFAVVITGCQKEPISRQELDSVALKVEVMAEVRQLLALHGVSGQTVEKTRTQLKNEIKDEVIMQLQMIAPDSEVVKAAQKLPQAEPVTGPTGAAEGEILRKGEGVADCHVKLVRLVEAETMAGLFKVSKEGVEFATVTDRDGKYRFESIPVGDYKFKWQLPDDSDWVRRLRDKPDVTIEQGKTKTIKAVETSRGLVSG